MNISEDDERVLDAFINGSLDFLVSQNLQLTQRGQIFMLTEIATSTGIAKIDFTRPIPLIKMRKNSVGYEWLPHYIEEQNFVPCREGNSGVLEFRKYELGGYTINQTSPNTLWKSFRRLIVKNRQLKILSDYEWYSVNNIIHEDFTYIVQIGTKEDLVFSAPETMIIWAEPDKDIESGLADSVWNLGSSIETSDRKLENSDRILRNSSLESKAEDLERKINILHGSLDNLHQYVCELFDFMKTYDREQSMILSQLNERVSSIELARSLNDRLEPNVEQREEPNEDFPIFNLTQDDTLADSSEVITTLMAPLN